MRRLSDFSGYTPVVTTTLLLVPAGWWVTATATDPNGNRSEFSRCEQSK